MIVGDLSCSGVDIGGLEIKRLFEPFFLRLSGMGRLALPAARRTFEAHGGSLSAALNPGGGVKFSFELPTELPYPLRSAVQS